MIANSSSPIRCGSIMICVLVVLLLVGLISIQSIQSLALIRSGTRQSMQLEQRQELIRLGQSLDWSTLPSHEIQVTLPLSIQVQSNQNTSAASKRIAVVRRLIRDGQPYFEIDELLPNQP